jgi:3-hydroxyisobutyrate dehydrogenase-like beta-hydroxyacid dehydrogenase
MSTVGPAAIERLASVLPREAALVDAPVLGSVREAEAGSLVMFVGGPEDVVGRVAPLLSLFGTTLHVGPLGTGAAAKLVANTTLLGTLGVLGEAVALGRALGLQDDALFSVLAATPLAHQAERRRDALASGEYPRRFALSLARKDADLIAGAAEAAGADLRLTAAVRTWFADAEAAGLADSDYSAVLAQITAADSRKPNETA